MEKITDNKTRLTIDFYLQKNIAKQILFSLSQKKKMEAMFEKSLQNLEGLVKEIELPVGEGYFNAVPSNHPSFAPSGPTEKCLQPIPKSSFDMRIIKFSNSLSFKFSNGY